MDMEHVIDTVRQLDGTLVLAPGPGTDFPEIAWGDTFFYYAPDGEVPVNIQPFATIVTKDYPDDTASELDPRDRWRVNVHVDKATFVELLGEDPRALTRPRDQAAADVVNPHPVYGPLGWICVVNPGERTGSTLLGLLRAAHEAARLRSQRRGASGENPPE